MSLALIREALVKLAEAGRLEDLSSMLLKLPNSGLLGWRQLERCLDTLYLYRGNSVYTSLGAIDKAVVVLQRRGLHAVVTVDCVQRVPPPPELDNLGRELHTSAVSSARSRRWRCDAAFQS